MSFSSSASTLNPKAAEFTPRSVHSYTFNPQTSSVYMNQPDLVYDPQLATAYRPPTFPSMPPDDFCAALQQTWYNCNDIAPYAVYHTQESMTAKLVSHCVYLLYSCGWVRPRLSSPHLHDTC
jgi:hypothetical protein